MNTFETYMCIVNFLQKLYSALTLVRAMEISAFLSGCLEGVRGGVHCSSARLRAVLNRSCPSSNSFNLSVVTYHINARFGVRNTRRNCKAFLFHCQKFN